MTEKLSNNKIKKLHNLNRQTDRIFKSKNNGLSFESNQRYREAMHKFNKYLVTYFKNPTLKRITHRQLKGFIKDQKMDNLNIKTIKTNITEVKTFNKINQGEVELYNDNKKYGLENRDNFTKKPPVSSRKELGDYSRLCIDSNKEHYAHLAQIQYHLGLRVKEAITLKTAQVREALYHQQLELNQTKGGKARILELNAQQLETLKKAYENRLSDNNVFVKSNQLTHQARRQYIDHLRNHREKFTQSKITPHSFRRAFANNEYNKRISSGIERMQVLVEVSKAMGHERGEVTRLYLREES